MPVTWGIAFKNAVLACLYSCVFYIIAAAIIIGGTMVSGATVDLTDPDSWITAMGTLLIFYFAGYIVCCLGSMASIIKAAGDAALQSR